MAYGLDTDSFLNAIYRMTSQRGFPAQVISDNGTNFVGAARELCELVNALDKTKIQELTVNRGVVWIFNPPSAPHFNGLHEILIKAAKRAMFHVLNKGTGSRHAEAVDVFQAAPHNFVTKRCFTAFNSYEFQAKS